MLVHSYFGHIQSAPKGSTWHFDSLSVCNSAETNWTRVLLLKKSVEIFYRYYIEKIVEGVVFTVLLIWQMT